MKKLIYFCCLWAITVTAMEMEIQKVETNQSSVSEEHKDVAIPMSNLVNHLPIIIDDITPSQLTHCILQTSPLEETSFCTVGMHKVLSQWSQEGEDGEGNDDYKLFVNHLKRTRSGFELEGHQQLQSVFQKLLMMAWKEDSIIHGHRISAEKRNTYISIPLSMATACLLTYLGSLIFSS